MLPDENFLDDVDRVKKELDHTAAQNVLNQQIASHSLTDWLVDTANKFDKTVDDLQRGVERTMGLE